MGGKYNDRRGGKSGYGGRGYGYGKGKGKGGKGKGKGGGKFFGGGDNWRN